MEPLAEMHLLLRERGWEPEWDSACWCWWWKRPDSAFVFATGGEADDPDWTLYTITTGEADLYGLDNQVATGETVSGLRRRLRNLAR